MRQFSHVKNTGIAAVYSEFWYFKTVAYQPEKQKHNVFKSSY